MLNIIGAPEWAWWLCAVYLAAIHNVTWNEEKQCIPLTAQEGITVDISKFFQFKFWDKVLYLDNQDNYPSSNELPGYFVGFADNCGDALTFKIYDDQTHCIVQVSVVRHYNDNNQVQFDPQLTDCEMLLTYPADYQKAKIEDVANDPNTLPK